MAGRHFDPSDAVTRRIGVAVVRPNRLVHGVAGNVAQEATAGTLRALGVIEGQVNANPGDDRTVIRHKTVDVVYSAAAVYGDPLVCTGAGELAPAGATPAVGSIVARCEGDVDTPGSLGPAYIY